MATVCIVQLLAGFFHGDGDPRRIHHVGEALGGAHDRGCVVVGPDAGKDALARRPWALDRLRVHVVDEVGVDALGCPPHRQLAQRRQVLGLEEALARAIRHIRHVDLALGEPLQQLVGRQVDEHDLVGVLEHVIGNGFAYPDAGDALQDVVEALEMLDIQRRPHVDAGGEQLLHVLPALGVAAAGDVGVRQLIEQQQARLARQRLVEIELAEDLVDVDDRLARDELKAGKQRFRLAPPVRLDQTDDHVAAFRLRRVRRRQHGVGLADARRRTQENLQPSASALLGDGEDGVRRSSLGRRGWHGDQVCLAGVAVKA